MKDISIKKKAEQCSGLSIFLFEYFFVHDVIVEQDSLE
jgi:hypothetical protein